MKYIKLLFINVVAICLVCISCDDESNSPTSFEPSAPHVAFQDYPDYMVDEGSSQVLEIPVVLNILVEEPVSVTYSVTETNVVAGTDYQITSDSPGTLIIPQNTKRGHIYVTTIDNDVPNGNLERSITITITGVSNEYSIGYLNKPNYISKKVIIEDDECVEQPSCNWWGALSVEDVGFTTYDGTGSAGANDMELTVVGNLPGSGWFEDQPIVFVLTPSAGDPTVGTAIAARQLFCDDCSGNIGIERYYEATGSFDIATGEISVAYTYTRGDGSTVWTGNNLIAN